jgi:hypothetical protein
MNRAVDTNGQGFGVAAGMSAAVAYPTIEQGV